MLKKKRYWVKDARTGLDYIIDGFSKSDVAKKLNLNPSLLVINRFHFLNIKSESEITCYDKPFQGY